MAGDGSYEAYGRKLGADVFRDGVRSPSAGTLVSGDKRFDQAAPGHELWRHGYGSPADYAGDKPQSSDAPVPQANIPTTGDDILSLGFFIGVIDGGAGNDRLVLDYSGTVPNGTGPQAYWGRTPTKIDFYLTDGVSELVWFTSSLFDSLEVVARNIEHYTITGTSGNDNIWGAGGNDVFYGGEGNDALRGGAGNDTLYGDGGDDTLRGEAGNDTVYGGAGNDTLFGEDGNDVLFGGAGDDSLNGGSGNDTLEGGDGNDLLYGQGGFDDLRGGAGNDLLHSFATSLTTGAFLDGGSGWDQATIDGYYFQTAIVGDIIRGFYTSDLAFQAINVERLSGYLTQFNDFVEVGYQIDSLNGGSGADTLIVDYSGELPDGSGRRAVSVNWNTGALSRESVLLSDGTLFDFSVESFSTLQIIGSIGDDVLTISSGTNYFIGGGGNDRMITGSGNDVLVADLGNDILTGGGGADIFVVRPAAGAVTITDFQTGFDKLNLNGFSFDQVASALTQLQSGATSVLRLSATTSVSFGVLNPALLSMSDFSFAPPPAPLGSSAAGFAQDLPTLGEILSASGLSSVTSHLGLFSEAAYTSATGVSQLEVLGWHIYSATTASGFHGLGDLSLIQPASGFPGFSLADGNYIQAGNAQVLLGRSADALIISFRGTDQLSDQIDWFQQADHVQTLVPLMEAILQLVESDASIRDVFFTGHSLGAAMAEFFYASYGTQMAGIPGVEVHAQNFATPGYNSSALQELSFVVGSLGAGLLPLFVLQGGYQTLLEWAQGETTPVLSFWTDFDPIGLASFLSDNIGQPVNISFSRNSLSDFANLIARHSQDLYADVPVMIDFAINAELSEFLNGAFAPGSLFINIGQQIASSIGAALASGSIFSMYSRLFIRADHLGGGEWSVGGAVADSGISDAMTVLLNSNVAHLMLGHLGASTLQGGAADDFLLGLDGPDRLKGQGGNDYLSGGNGNDSLYGGAGDDIVSGGAGADYLDGEAGNDVLSGGGGRDRLFGGDGDDFLWGGEDTDKMYGGAGNDILDGWTETDFIYGEDGDDEIWGWTGNDRLYGGNGSDTLLGEDGADFLYGGAGTDFLIGGSGNDILFGDADNDELYGGTGNDRLYGGDGDDYLTGDDGIDTLQGQAGNDRIFGGARDDYLSGGDGNDQLDGGTGNDRLYGDAGSDTLIGGAGDDLLSGGSGADTFRFDQAHRGSDRVLGLEAIDRLVFSGFGYATVADVLARMTQSGSHVIFSDQGVTIRFDYTTLAQVQAVLGNAGSSVNAPAAQEASGGTAQGIAGLADPRSLLGAGSGDPFAATAPGSLSSAAFDFSGLGQPAGAADEAFGRSPWLSGAGRADADLALWRAGGIEPAFVFGDDGLAVRLADHPDWIG